MRLSIQSTLTAFFLICRLSLHAQDPHFSQYFSSPLSYNPAFTGKIEGPHRIASNFRNQWLGQGLSYTTSSISVDSKMFSEKTQNNIAGIGVMALNDRAASGSYISNYFAISGAYHQALDGDGMKHLGIGFQAGFGSRMIDFSKTSFNAQFIGNGFDLSLPSTELFTAKRASYFDFNVGVLYDVIGESSHFFIGSAFYHTTQPQFSFLGNDTQKIPSRFTIHSGYAIDAGVDNELIFSGQFMTQATAREIVFGVIYGKHIEEQGQNLSLYGGLFYRSNDAVYPYLGFKINGLQIGFSYDITTSSLNLGASKNNSIEISAVYYFLDRSYIKKAIPWY